MELTPETWETLRCSGVPVGAPTKSEGADWAATRNALQALSQREVSEQLLTPLCAWLDAFEHHWPRAFAKHVCCHDLAPALERLRASPETDKNRRLKFQRIARANLARLV